MAARLGGSQISSLLESVPGIASVLRSPVADAIVNMVRAGAGLGTFDKGMAKELIQYAVRRGLLPIAEGDELLAEVDEAVGSKRRGRASKTAAPAKKKPAAKPKATKAAPAKTAKKTTRPTAKRAAKPAAKKPAKSAARSSSKAAAKKPKSSKTSRAKRK